MVRSSQVFPHDGRREAVVGEELELSFCGGLDDTRGNIPRTSPNSACLRVLIMRPVRAFRLQHAQKTLDLQHLQISWKLARENPT